MDIVDFKKECVKIRLRDRAYSSFKQVSRISNKSFSREEVKALNNLAKNNDLVIQKTDKGNNMIVLNRSDYISKLCKIVEDTSKFKIVNIEEGKGLKEKLSSYGRTNNMSPQKFRRSRQNF